ncbi:MAG: crotonase [Proteobacteria bacterium]|nr:MAG: crotonase [Pseudomonadota bacterium]
MSEQKTQASSNILLTSRKNGVLTITMNQPKRLNGWTMDMMDSFKAAFLQAGKDDEIKAVIFTGTGNYYSAGVNLGGTMKPSHPRTMHRFVVDYNRTLFETFLECPKPILVAVNGPAIGASVTSAALCDAIIASEKATFSTPFASLGITPEGCSSIQFERIMGKKNAQRMLGKEGWKPTAAEALEAGLVKWVVPDNRLSDEAQRIAEEWVEQGVTRSYPGGSTLEELEEVNKRESVQLADAFTESPFLKEQAVFLFRKKKWLPAAMFFSAWALRPLWSRLL